jgi:hypothetical protein
MLLERLTKRQWRIFISIQTSWAVCPSSVVPENRCSDALVVEYDLSLDLKYDTARQFYIRIPSSEIEGRTLPPVFTNVFRNKNMIECQTLELMKRNQKVRILDVICSPGLLKLHVDYSFAPRSGLDE